MVDRLTRMAPTAGARTIPAQARAPAATAEPVPEPCRVVAVPPVLVVVLHQNSDLQVNWGS
jgi:hypothetical protein